MGSKEDDLNEDMQDPLPRQKGLKHSLILNELTFGSGSGG